MANVEVFCGQTEKQTDRARSMALQQIIPIASPHISGKSMVPAKVSTLLFTFNFLLWKNGLKGGYLDFSHLTELENIYITEIYRKKQ